MDEDKIDKVLKKGYEEFLELEKDTFTLHSKKQEIEVYVKKSTGESDIIKGVGYTKKTPEELYSILNPKNSVKDVKYYNPKLVSREIIKE